MKKFSELAIGELLMFKTLGGTCIGPLVKISDKSARDSGGAQYCMHDSIEIIAHWSHEEKSFLPKRELSRREAWEELAVAWHGAEKGGDGRFYAADLERPSISECISRLWMLDKVSTANKDKMKKMLGKISRQVEDMFGHDEESAKGRVGFCLEQAASEVDHSEILQCNGDGTHCWKCDFGERPAYGWVFSEKSEVMTWNVLCYNCGYPAMEYEFGPKPLSNGLLYRPQAQVQEFKKEVSVFSSKTGLAHSAQGAGFQLK